MVSLSVTAPALAPASLWPRREIFSWKPYSRIVLIFSFLAYIPRCFLGDTSNVFPPSLHPVIVPIFPLPLTTERKRRNIFKTQKVLPNIYHWPCWEQTPLLCFNQACFDESYIIWTDWYYTLKRQMESWLTAISSSSAEVWSAVSQAGPAEFLLGGLFLV